MQLSTIIKVLAGVILIAFTVLAIRSLDVEPVELKVEQSEKLAIDHPTLMQKVYALEEETSEKEVTDAPKKDSNEQAERQAETEPESEVTWRDNPNDCDQSKQYIAAEKPFNCIDKPTPTRTQQSQPASSQSVTGSGSCEAEIAKYNWNRTVATNVARAESGLRPDARGDVHLTYWQNGVRYGDSWGCFQIRYLPGRPSPSQLVNAEFNVRYAYQMYQSQGWSPWSVCRNGAARCY